MFFYSLFIISIRMSVTMNQMITIAKNIWFSTSKHLSSSPFWVSPKGFRRIRHLLSCGWSTWPSKIHFWMFLAMFTKMRGLFSTIHELRCFRSTADCLKHLCSVFFPAALRSLRYFASNRWSLRWIHRRPLLVHIILLLAVCVNNAYAVDLGSPPVIEDDTALDQYLRDLRKASRNLRVTTTSPNGNRRGLRGDTIFYNDGSDLKLCRNTSTTAGGGTSWVCEAASSESQLCFEGATANDFETCFSITDPTADRTVTFRDSSGTVMLQPGSEAQGDVLYHNGTIWTRLGVGTSGQFLQTQGASANPQWASPSDRKSVV